MVTKKAEYIKLVIVLIVMLLILVGFIFYLSIPVLSSKTIILETQPVDPFDPIRGQYIIIRYDISRVPSQEGISEGETVYVVLEEDAEGIGRFESVTRNKPDGDVLFIKGSVESINGENMNIDYYIGQYYFERNAKFSTENMDVEVSLADNGRAAIKELVRDGKPIEITYQNKTFTS